MNPAGLEAVKRLALVAFVVTGFLSPVAALASAVSNPVVVTACLFMGVMCGIPVLRWLVVFALRLFVDGMRLLVALPLELAHALAHAVSVCSKPRLPVSPLLMCTRISLVIFPLHRICASPTCDLHFPSFFACFRDLAAECVSTDTFDCFGLVLRARYRSCLVFAISHMRI